MPRILPRLIQRLQASPSPQKYDPFNVKQRRSRPISLRKPLPPVPSFHPSEHARSLLLTPGNPIVSSRDYIRHKSLPPRVNVSRSTTSRRYTYDRPRNMTDEERRWWASPYLRMLSSPLRLCFLTQQRLPSAFLIRLGIMRVRSSQGERIFAPSKPAEGILMPDGIEHPKFRGRRAGKAGYILCWKAAIEYARETGGYKRTAVNVRIHSLLEDQIRHLLRLRVLQELQLVADSLRYRPTALSGNTLIRKLTRDEWNSFKSTGTMPVANAMAILVVPPLNRNPETKKRPEGSMSSFPPAVPDNPSPRTFGRPVLPLCTLHPTTDHEALPKDVHLAQAQIPLYNGVSLFPDPEQRAALFDILTRILALERKARFKSNAARGAQAASVESVAANEAPVRQDGKRASHAFVLMSDEHTAQTADMAAVGLALWRIPMFEGMGWEDGPSEWTKRYKHFSTFGNEKYAV